MDRVPFQLFGPQTFYRWLSRFEEELEPESQVKIRRIRASSVIPEYVKDLRALTQPDFGHFIDWALNDGEWPPEWPGKVNASVLGRYDLEGDFEEIREGLIAAFGEKRVKPQPGIRILTQMALEEADEADNGLSLTQSSVFPPRQLQGLQDVHKGVDQALWHAECVLNLLIEFLTLVLSHLGWIDVGEGEKWLYAIGLSSVSDPITPVRAASWHEKQRILGNQICENFWEIEKRIMDRREDRRFRQAPDTCKHFWNQIQMLVEHCNFKQGPDKWYATTNTLMEILDQLCYCRNRLRHASHKFHRSGNIPEVYVRFVPKVHDYLQRLVDIAEKPYFPCLAKVWDITRDCYGVSKLTLRVDFMERPVKAHYVLGIDFENLTSGVKPDAALTQADYEFFLFPSPNKGQTQIINPLLLRRDYSARDIGSIPLKEESIAALRKIHQTTVESPLEESLD